MKFDDNFCFANRHVSISGHGFHYVFHDYSHPSLPRFPLFFSLTICSMQGTKVWFIIACLNDRITRDYRIINQFTRIFNLEVLSTSVHTSIFLI